MRVVQICLLSLFFCAAFGLYLPKSHGDTVHLKNGRVIHGKVQRLNGEGGPVRVQFGDGYMIFAPNDVDRVEKNDLKAPPSKSQDVPTAPAPLGEAVLITLNSGDNYYGSGSYFGWPTSADDDPILVLTLPGGGTLRVPRANIANVQKVEFKEPAAEPARPEDGLIRTTHLLHLKNGRKVRGDLVPSGPTEPIQLKVGRLGVLSFPREKVEQVEAAPGTYKLPAPTEQEVVPAPKTKEQIREELKAELRREILRELLEALTDEKIEKRLDALEGKALGMRLTPSEVDAETLMEIQYQLRELCRQRSTNRVRAEAALKRLGPIVTPFLTPAASHPFELTRRAVQRIIHQVGDLRGVPLAIEGLNDPDVFVRQLAHGALTKLIGKGVGYNPHASEKQRVAAQQHYRELWREQLREVVRADLSS